MYDIIIVGGGPAGMTAALYALRSGKTALVIEKHGFGGQITYSPKVENYPGTLQMSGNEFADKFMDQIMSQGAEVELDCVTEIKSDGNMKTVFTADGARYVAKAVVIATGVKHRMLGLEKEAELVGNGISFCAVCDGDFYAGKTVCVAGGGNSALQEAIFLSAKCKEVIILQDMKTLTGEKKLREFLEAKDNVRIVTGVKITELITENGELTGVMVDDSGEQTKIECSGLFVAIGLIPENDNFRDITKLDERGYFDSDETCVTITDGIFVAGDCRAKTVRQLTTAVADGATAALAACRYIDSNF